MFCDTCFLTEAASLWFSTRKLFALRANHLYATPNTSTSDSTQCNTTPAGPLFTSCLFSQSAIIHLLLFTMAKTHLLHPPFLSVSPFTPKNKLKTLHSISSEFGYGLCQSMSRHKHSAKNRQNYGWEPISKIWVLCIFVSKQQYSSNINIILSIKYHKTINMDFGQQTNQCVGSLLLSYTV